MMEKKRGRGDIAMGIYKYMCDSVATIYCVAIHRYEKNKYDIAYAYHRFPFGVFTMKLYTYEDRSTKIFNNLNTLCKNLVPDRLDPNPAC
jgi:hypothetical protein